MRLLSPTLGLVLCLATASHAATVTFTTGYLTFDAAGSSRVYIENSNPVLDSKGATNPPCSVHVVIADGSSAVVSEGDVLAQPGVANIYDGTLPPLLTGPRGTMRAEMSYSKSSLCSPKTIRAFLDDCANCAGNRYELQVRSSNRVR